MPGLLGRRLRFFTNHYDERSFASKLRKKRFALFASLLDRVPKPVRILDVGGDAAFWQVRLRQGDGIRVTLLNLLANSSNSSGYSMVRADARCMPFRAREFEVVFSNSVIEHLGTFDQQREMAAEIQRVGKRYFVQTPSKWFPLEPHFLFPVFQFLPLSWRVWIASRYTAGWYCHPGDRNAAKEEVESIRLLSKRDCARLFPEAEIKTEWMLGLPKSYLIVGGWRARVNAASADKR